jgi:hypothetical protein
MKHFLGSYQLRQRKNAASKTFETKSGSAIAPKILMMPTFVQSNKRIGDGAVRARLSYALRITKFLDLERRMCCFSAQ